MALRKPSRRFYSLSVAGAVVGLALTGLFALAIVSWENVFHPYEWMGKSAMVALFVMPSLLALLAMGERPMLLLGAAVISLCLSFLSMAGATLMFLIPAVLYFGAFANRARSRPKAGLTLGLIVPVALAGAALAVVIYGTHAVCVGSVVKGSSRIYYADPLFGRIDLPGYMFEPGESVTLSEGGECSTSVLFPTQSLSALSFVAAGVFAGAVLGRSRSVAYDPKARVPLRRGFRGERPDR